MKLPNCFRDMRYLKLGALALVFIPFVTVAQTVQLQDLTRELDTVREDVMQRNTPESVPAMKALSELDGALKRNNPAELQQALEKALAAPDIPPSLRKLLALTQSQVPELILQVQDEYVEELDALLDHARTTILSAESEKQLRPLLREAEALRIRRPGGNSALVSRADRKLEALREQLEAWLNIREALDGGDIDRAITLLQQRLSDRDAFALIPHAEIEKLIAYLTASPPANARTFGLDPIQSLRRIKTLADARAAASEITSQRRDPNSSHPSVSSFLPWISTLQLVLSAMDSGDVGEAWHQSQQLLPGPQANWAPEAFRVRGLVMEELLPKYLRLTPGEGRRPEESSTDHLARLMAAAAKEKRWEDVLRLLIAHNRIYRAPQISNDVGFAIRSFLEGQAYEEAGEYLLAAASYRSALRGAGPLFPVADAVARLKALQEKHPDILEESRKLTEQNRLLLLVQQAEPLITTLRRRVEALEAWQKAQNPGQPAGAPINVGEIRAKVARMELTVTRMAELTGTIEKLAERAERIETMLGPALDGAPTLAGGSVKLWLAPDYTIYRTALPPALEKGINWVVRRDGRLVLMRGATKDMFYRYHEVTPGNYSIELVQGEQRISNVIEYTLTPEVAQTLKPPQDDDWDQDGAKNPIEIN
ncbi:MAG: hypothetical protein ACO1QR_00120 [Chthoniobacteraceae bacterium]